MNKLTKIFLWASAVCIGLGIILFVIGVKNNGLDSANDILNMNDVGIHVGVNRSSSKDAKETPSAGVGTLSDGDECIFDASDFDNIEMSLGAINAVVKTSSDGKVHIINESNQKVNAFIMSDKLKIKSEEDVKLNSATGSLIIMLPAGIALDTLDMNVGAVKIECEDELKLKCENLIMEVGAGDVRLTGIEAEDIKINLGAGELVLDKVVAEDLGCDVGMGNVDFAGDVTGNMNIDCSVGNVTMLLDSEKSAHNFEYNVSAGNLIIDNEEMSGFGSSKIGNTGADSNYNIEVNMGNVTINFANKM